MPLSFQVYSVLIESAKNSQIKNASTGAFLLQNEHSNSFSYQTYPKSILHRICPLSIMIIIIIILALSSAVVRLFAAVLWHFCFRFCCVLWASVFRGWMRFFFSKFAKHFEYENPYYPPTCCNLSFQRPQPSIWMPPWNTKSWGEP